jgi:hypothetical protein
MKIRTFTLILFAFAILCSLPVVAQQQRLSPHETIGAVVDGNRVTIVYGRPYVKHPGTGEVRKIWGGLVPYGQVWRTGADEATLLITQKTIELGGVAIPAGAYTLWTLPTEDGKAKLTYDPALDVGRIELKKEALEGPVSQFTISVAANAAGGGVLKLAWENTQYSTTFTVKK